MLLAYIIFCWKKHAAYSLITGNSLNPLGDIILWKAPSSTFIIPLLYSFICHGCFSRCSARFPTSCSSCLIHVEKPKVPHWRLQHFTSYNQEYCLNCGSCYHNNRKCLRREREGQGERDRRQSYSGMLELTLPHLSPLKLQGNLCLKPHLYCNTQASLSQKEDSDSKGHLLPT